MRAKRINRRELGSACLGAAIAALAFTTAVDASPTESEEEHITQALDEIVRAAGAADSQMLATHLACYTGVEGPGTLHVRPCTPTHDREWVEAVAAEIRSHFTSSEFVLDWLTHEPVTANEPQAIYRTQVKVRSAEPPHLVELVFVYSGGSGDRPLLRDVGTLRLQKPRRPPPASSLEAARQSFEFLLRLAATYSPQQERGDGALRQAADHLGCGSAEATGWTACDPDLEQHRRRVLGVLRELSEFLAAVGQAGWGFVDPATAGEFDQTGILEIGYLDPDQSGVTRATAATFALIGERQLLVSFAHTSE